MNNPLIYILILVLLYVKIFKVLILIRRLLTLLTNTIFRLLLIDDMEIE